MEKKISSILLIDDDNINNYLSKIFLERMDCAEHIVSFESATKALDFLRIGVESDRNPDLIFLDINMPEMNGWEFLDRYNELQDGLSRPIIFMLSSSINISDQQKSKENESVRGFISKPLDEEKIQTVINNCFSSSTL